MHSYIQPVAEELYALADAQKAAPMKAYMKHHFEFLGVPMPARRGVCKPYLKQHKLATEAALVPVVKELWTMPEREFQYFGMEVLAAHKKLWSKAVVSLLEYCIGNKSWWDTVDFIATECAGHYFKKFPDEVRITKGWSTSDNMWLQRTSLLFQKTYKQQTDTNLLAEFILHLSSSKEFFIRKAIGWILREYAKTNPAWVMAFVQAHELSPLSKREALKHIG